MDLPKRKVDNYDNIAVDKFVIIPNHIHLIITNQTGGHGDPPVQIYDIKGLFLYRIAKRGCRVKVKCIN